MEFAYKGRFVQVSEILIKSDFSKIPLIFENQIAHTIWNLFVCIKLIPLFLHVNGLSHSLCIKICEIYSSKNQGHENIFFRENNLNE